VFVVYSFYLFWWSPITLQNIFVAIHIQRYNQSARARERARAEKEDEDILY